MKQGYAREQAVKMARQHRLYLEIVNQSLIETALVELRLRETLPKQQHEEVVLSPFYVELEPEADT